jgi:Leucine-rich repeat (LRR) protein
MARTVVLTKAEVDQLLTAIGKDEDGYAEAQRRIKECREKRKKKLDLSYLHIKAIPPEIAELETLVELDISCYTLTEVPDFIGNISSLQTLRIQSSTIETIPASIGNLKNLRTLRIHSDKIAELPGEIGNCISLTVLDVQCPELKTLPPSFSHLKKLQSLCFSSCNLSVLPDYICGWTELEELKVSMQNTFQGPYTKVTKIPHAIGNLKKLRTLVLDGTLIKSIPPSLGECPLEYLKITGSFKTLPETFAKLSKLKEIELNAYKLRELPGFFGNLSSLEKLCLYGPITEIPSSFGNLSSLKELTIRTPALKLPETFGRLSSLEKLYIDDDKMTALPKAIGKCINLKRVYLNDSDSLVELPAAFGNLKKLEDLRIDAFALKKLPDVFDNFTALTRLSIFSGALTIFPASIGNLKKLKSLALDAYHVHKLPESFKKLSYVKDLSISMGRDEQKMLLDSRNRKKQRNTAVVDFDELKDMSWQYRWKFLGQYSLKKLEALLCSVPRKRDVGDEEKEIVKAIVFNRGKKLNRAFKWTPETIKRVVEVNDTFLEAWEEGFSKAKAMIDILYENETDKASFWDNYAVEITLDPQILIKDNKTGDWEYPYGGVYSVLMDYLSDFELEIDIGGREYDPATKDESGFRQDPQISRDVNWIYEGFGDIDLKDHYICHAFHVLYSHYDWAKEDILKINSIESEVKVIRGRLEYVQRFVG